MKKVWIVACALGFLALAGFTPAPSHALLTSEALAVILGAPANPGTCAPRQNEVSFAAAGSGIGTKALCSASVNCGFTTISCQGNNSATSCTAVNPSCPSELGHVTCDGVTTTCPCTCGTVIQQRCCECEYTGSCFACCRCNGGSPTYCARQCGL